VSLAEQSWKRVSVHEVVAEFLANERHKFSLPSMEIIDKPNLADPSENHDRLRLLMFFRCQLFCEIPPDTEWFEVNQLTNGDLADLRVIARCGWDGGDENELSEVAKRKPSTLTTQPAQWQKPILWGHDRQGPFTIFEGNHRLTAYVSAGCTPDLHIPVLVGISPTPCVFHMTDPPRILVNDLWRKDWPAFTY
jgi:hypothetical protein